MAKEKYSFLGKITGKVENKTNQSKNTIATSPQQAVNNILYQFFKDSVNNASENIGHFSSTHCITGLLTTDDWEWDIEDSQILNERPLYALSSERLVDSPNIISFSEDNFWRWDEEEQVYWLNDIKWSVCAVTVEAAKQIEKERGLI